MINAHATLFGQRLVSRLDDTGQELEPQTQPRGDAVGITSTAMVAHQNGTLRTFACPRPNGGAEARPPSLDRTPRYDEDWRRQSAARHSEMRAQAGRCLNVYMEHPGQGIVGVEVSMVRESPSGRDPVKSMSNGSIERVASNMIDINLCLTDHQTGTRERLDFSDLRRMAEQVKAAFPMSGACPCGFDIDSGEIIEPNTGISVDRRFFEKLISEPATCQKVKDLFRNFFGYELVICGNERSGEVIRFLIPTNPRDEPNAAHSGQPRAQVELDVWSRYENRFVPLPWWVCSNIATKLALWRSSSNASCLLGAAGVVAINKDFLRQIVSDPIIALGIRELLSPN